MNMEFIRKFIEKSKKFIKKFKKFIKKFIGKFNKQEKEKKPESKEVDDEIREARFMKEREEIIKFEDERREEIIKLEDERIKFIDDVAKDIASKFTYNQIIQAVNSSGFRGLEVYGYLELKYPREWVGLLEAGIFDKCAYYAEKDFEPEFVRVMNEVDIKKYVKSPVIFKEELRFRNHPDRPFRRAVFYSPKPLREFVRWINNYPLYINGYRSNVILGKVTLILLGWALPDFPQILVSFTPNQNQAIFEAIIASEDLKDDTLDLLKKIIFYYRRETKVSEMKVIEAQMEAERYEKKWSNLLDKMSMDIRDDPKESSAMGTELPRGMNRSYWFILAGVSALAIISIIFNFFR